MQLPPELCWSHFSLQDSLQPPLLARKAASTPLLQHLLAKGEFLDLGSQNPHLTALVLLQKC